MPWAVKLNTIRYMNRLGFPSFETLCWRFFLWQLQVPQHEVIRFRWSESCYGMASRRAYNRLGDQKFHHRVVHRAQRRQPCHCRRILSTPWTCHRSLYTYGQRQTEQRCEKDRPPRWSIKIMWFDVISVGCGLVKFTKRMNNYNYKVHVLGNLEKSLQKHKLTLNWLYSLQLLVDQRIHPTCL